MLVSIEPARAGVDLHTFECAVCNHALTTLAVYEDPMHSRALGRWLQGDFAPIGVSVAAEIGKKSARGDHFLRAS
jgi:hypothetical protein